MMLKPGDSAPDIILNTLEDQKYPLAKTWQSGQNVLLIFTRHLG